MIFVFGVHHEASDSAPHRTRLDQLMERRDAIYENLRDLRFEYRAGKYSEADYDEIKQSLEIEAARVLADMDIFTGGAPTPATRQAAAEKRDTSDEHIEDSVISRRCVTRFLASVLFARARPVFACGNRHGHGRATAPPENPLPAWT